MPELIATPTHPRANSYLTLEELDELLLPNDWWQALTPTQKENAAIIATATLDGVPYAGQKLFIGQRLEFPRRSHPTLKASWPFLKYEDNYSAVGFVVENETTNVSFDLDIFPDELMIVYHIGGSTYTADMASDGSISGPYLTGTCNMTAGYVELSSSQSFDVGTNISYTGEGYSRTVFSHSAFRFDPEKVLDGFLKYGACRVIDTYSSLLLPIFDNRVASGEIICSTPLLAKPSTQAKVIVIAPILSDVKIAQAVQVVHQFRRDSYSPIEGIRSIRIGDTQVVFNERTSGYSRYVRMASRFGIHPAAFVRLVPYTIYAESVSIVRQ